MAIDVATASPPEWLALAPGEEVWFRGTPSGNLLLASLTIGFLLLTGMSMLVSVGTDLATGRRAMFTVLVVILAVIVGVFITIERREYVLTNERVYVGVGLRSKRVRSVALDDVRDVSLEQSNWQQHLHLGTLRFVTHDEADTLSFALIEEPQSVYSHILDLVAAENEATAEIF